MKTLREILRVLFILAVMMPLQSFMTRPSHAPYELAVRTDGVDFYSISEELYYQFELSEDKLALEVFQKALRGYVQLKYTDQLENDRYLTLMDFSKSSSLKRLWVFDLNTKTVAFNELVAHGKNSGYEFAQSFSNTPSSKKSSLGFYVTGESYNGKHRYSLKLRGLEYGFNSNAFARGIVIHGAYYVNEQIANNQKGVGRSYGCPAVSQTVNKPLVDTIKGGSCLFIYHPQNYYNSRSKILNSEQFIPIELIQALIH